MSNLADRALSRSLSGGYLPMNNSVLVVAFKEDKWWSKLPSGSQARSLPPPVWSELCIRFIVLAPLTKSCCLMEGESGGHSSCRVAALCLAAAPTSCLREITL